MKIHQHNSVAYLILITFIMVVSMIRDGSIFTEISVICLCALYLGEVIKAKGDKNGKD